MSIEDWARVVWDYHHVNHTLAKADCIIALGSHDTRVAERGAEVFLEGWAPLLVCSGHLGGLTSGIWTRSEAEIFADVAAGQGVPRERILIESRSTNTGENVDFSRQMLVEKGLLPKKAIAVQKPYMERRTLATFAQRWPEQTRRGAHPSRNTSAPRSATRVSWLPSTRMQSARDRA